MRGFEPAKSGLEYDATTRWKAFLCVFHNTTGLSRFAKNQMNRRRRRNDRLRIRKQLFW